LNLKAAGASIVVRRFFSPSQITHHPIKNRVAQPPSAVNLCVLGGEILGFVFRLRAITLR
jgi:hypothetical protein